MTEWFASRPDLTEKIYSGSVYPVVARILSAISRHFSFSLGDMFYLLAGLTLLLLILLAILRKIPVRQMLLQIFNMASVLYILFYWLWGFNYFRQPFNERLGVQKSVAETEQFMAVFESLIEQANTYQPYASAPLSRHEADSLVEATYARHAEFLKISYPMGTRRPKNISLGSFFAKAGISGYYGPYFNEIHLNPHLHPLELPVVLAHEKAHQFGITSEAEASFYAWFVCENSDSNYLRYCNSLFLLRYFLNHGNSLEGFRERVTGISEPVRQDLRAIRDHWMAMRNEKIDRVASQANDAFLKTNKVRAGIADYKGVVAYVMDYKTDSLLRRP